CQRVADGNRAEDDQQDSQGQKPAPVPPNMFHPCQEVVSHGCLSFWLERNGKAGLQAPALQTRFGIYSYFIQDPSQNDVYGHATACPFVASKTNRLPCCSRLMPRLTISPRPNPHLPGENPMRSHLARSTGALAVTLLLLTVATSHAAPA